MKNWKGKWIIAVAILHTVFALVKFGAQFKSIIASGIINSLNSMEETLVTWFFLFGILILACGLLVHSFEKRSSPIPKSAALTLLVLSVLGVALIPTSGFWLMFPPVLAILFSKNHV